MRKTALLIATALLTAALTACSGNGGTSATTSNSASNAEQQTATASATTSEDKTQGASQASTGDSGIDVDKGLLNVEITIPAETAEYYGFNFESQEEADAYAKEQGFKSATLGDDGSVTIVMSKSQHKKTMEGLSQKIDEALQEMIGSEDYPNITAVEHNDNYTSFTVTTKSEELGFNESFSVLAFYIYGGMYNSFNGTPADNIHVDFINEASGEVIDSFDSENMGDGSTADASSESDSADPADYAAQLDKEEYTYDDGYGSTYHFIVLKNNSDQTLTIATNSVAYNGSGDKIGADSGHLDALGPQSEQLVIESFDNVSDVDHFDTTISASKAKWYEDATANIEVEADVLGDKVIEVEADVLGDKVIITCTNNGDEPAQSVEGRVIFLKDGECVGFSTNYFMNEDGKLKPGESLTKQFDYYNGTFDEAKYYIAGTISK